MFKKKDENDKKKNQKKNLEIDNQKDENNQKIDEDLKQKDLKNDDDSGQTDFFLKQIEKLTKDLEDSKQIASKAQYDYINLKMDFDNYIKRNEEYKKEQKIDILIDIVKKFIPFVENLRKSLMNITNKEDVLSKWVQMVYDKFIETLESMNILQIESIWLTPDSVLHEPISIQETKDNDLKWKIILEFEKWFVYRKDWIQKIINTSKVVVGS